VHRSERKQGIGTKQNKGQERNKTRGRSETKQGAGAKESWTQEEKEEG